MQRLGGGLLELRRAIRAQDPDVVHPYLAVECGRVAVASPRSSYAVVWGFRSGPPVDEVRSLRSRIWTPVLARLSRRSDLVIANSNVGLDYLHSIGYSLENTTVVQNGIDTDRFFIDRSAGAQYRADANVPAAAKVVGMIGRVEPIKGQVNFLATFAEVTRQLNSAHLLIVGRCSSDDEERIHRTARVLGLEGRVTLMPSINEPRVAINACDVLAMPSLSEGFPNVVAEALACGVPAVVHDVGDAGLIVGDQMNVIPIGDRSSFVDRLIIAMSSQHDPNALRQSVMRFGVLQLVETTEALLRSCVDSKNKQA